MPLYGEETFTIGGCGHRNGGSVDDATPSLNLEQRRSDGNRHHPCTWYPVEVAFRVPGCGCGNRTPRLLKETQTMALQEALAMSGSFCPDFREERRCAALLPFLIVEVFRFVELGRVFGVQQPAATNAAK